MATPTFFTELDDRIVHDYNVYTKESIPDQFFIYIAWDTDVTGLTLSDFSISFATGTPAGNMPSPPPNTLVHLREIEGGRRLYRLRCSSPYLKGSFGGNQQGVVNVTLTLKANAVAEGNTATTFVFNQSIITRLNNFTLQTPAITNNLSEFEVAGTFPSIYAPEYFFYYQGYLYGIGVGTTTLLAFNADASFGALQADIAFSGIPGNGSSFLLQNGKIFLSHTMGATLLEAVGGATTTTNLLTFGAALANARFVLAKEKVYNPTMDKVGDVINLDAYNSNTATDLKNTETLTIDKNGTALQFVANANHLTLKYHEGRFYVRDQYFIYVLDETLKVIPELTYPLSSALSTSGGTTQRDVSFSGENLYLVEGGSPGKLHKLPFTKFFKPKVQHQLYPTIITGTGTLDLRDYVSGYRKIVFDQNFDVPSWLSLSGNTLTIGATPATTALSVKLLAVNRRGTTPVSLDLFIIKPATAPTWLDVDQITADNGDAIDMTPLVVEYDSLSSRTLPSGTTFNATTGVLTAGAKSGTTTLRATKGSTHRDVTFELDVQQPEIATGALYRYEAKIGGVDVSEDLIKSFVPQISASLDPVQINVAKVDQATFALQARDGKYSAMKSGNFWTTNSLNTNGHREPCSLSILFGSEKQLIFHGTIINMTEDVSTDSVRFEVADASYQLRILSQEDTAREARFIGPTKILTTSRVHETYEGTYSIEENLQPIEPNTATVWTESGTKLTRSRIENASEGVVPDDTVLIERDSFKTQGGRTTDRLFAQYATPFRYKKADFLARQVARSMGIYNPDIDIPSANSTTPCLQNRGNPVYNVLETHPTVTPTDWVYNSTDNKVYILASQASDKYEDLLIEHDLSTDEQQIINKFDKDLHCIRLAYAGSGVFYVLVTDATSDDLSHPNWQKSLEYVKRLDRGWGNGSKIIKWVRSTDTQTDHVAANHATPPQPGTHYWVGFNNAQRTWEWEGIVPDSRGTFKMRGTDLYYRWASRTHFGVARVSATGTVTVLWNIQRQNFYMNHLKFDFDIDTSGTVFIAWVEQTSTGSTLKIEKRGTGAATAVLTDTKTFAQLTENVQNLAEIPAGTEGGWYAGVHELLMDGSRLLLSIEVGRTEQYYATSTTRALTRSGTYGAGAILFEIDTSQTTPSLISRAEYPFSQFAGRSFVSHDSRIWWYESPSERYEFRPYNPKLDDFDTNVAYNTAQPKGTLKSLDSSGTVRSHGGLWWESEDCAGMGLQMLSFGSGLHGLVHYGDPNAVLRINSGASAVDSYQWISRATEINFIFSRLEKGTAYEQLTGIARKTASILSISRNRISLKPRRAREASADGAITATAQSIAFHQETRAFPSTGYLLIDDEIISYTGKSTVAFTGCSRGQNKTTPATHTDRTKIYFLDTLIDPASYLRVAANTDTNNLYNVIRTPAGVEARDQDSIDKFGERVYVLDLGLDRHEVCWTEFVIGEYLKVLKDPKILMQAELKAQWNLKIGDVCYFQYADIAEAFRIISIKYKREITVIQGRTL